MEIYSENLLAEFEVDTRVFGETAEKILVSLLGAEGEASVVFVSDEKIRELNRTYRGVDRATDVLSFSLEGDAGSHGVIGDVYISLDTAEKQAKEFAVSLEEELLRLLIHGLLHLAGHTHDGKGDAARMRRLERLRMKEHIGAVAGGAKRRTRRRGRRPNEERDGRRDR